MAEHVVDYVPGKPLEPINLVVGQHNRIVVKRPPKGRVFALGRSAFAEDSAFPTPGVLPLLKGLALEGVFEDVLGEAKKSLANLFSLASDDDENDEPRRLQVYGHASLEGNDGPNKDLSERRARAFHALLVADVDAFVETAGDDVTLAEQQAILRTLGCDPGPVDGEMGPRTQDAIRHFQLDYNDGIFHRHRDAELRHVALPESGELDGSTADALLEAYVVALSPAIDPADFVDAMPHMGCSEFNPVAKDSDEPNRRIVLVEHERSSKALEEPPCIAGDTGACPLDDDPRFAHRCPYYRDLVDDQPKRPQLVVHDDLRWLPLEGGDYRLSALTTLPDGAALTFEVVRAKSAEPDDLEGFSDWAVLAGPLEAEVQCGVASVRFTPVNPRLLADPAHWFRRARIESDSFDPRAFLTTARAYAPPRFRVTGGGTTALSRPPGNSIDRLRLDFTGIADGARPTHVQLRGQRGQLFTAAVDGRRVAVEGSIFERLPEGFVVDYRLIFDHRVPEESA